MITLEKYIEGLQEVLKKNPELKDKPVAYSSDDEGNSYHLVHNEPSPCQVEDNTTHYLEIVGYYEEGEDDIAKEDINCIIIN